MGTVASDSQSESSTEFPFVSDDDVISDDSEEEAQLVADTILEAATTDAPKLRYEPGVSAPEVLAGRRSMNDEDWRAYVMSELGMAEWLQPENEGVPA